MKIIEEAQRRKAEIESELKLINQLLALYSETKVVKNLPESISEWPLSVRSVNILHHNGIKTLQQLLCFSQSELLKAPNFGRKSLREIEEFIAPLKLSYPAKVRWDGKLQKYIYDDEDLSSRDTLKP